MAKTETTHTLERLLNLVPLLYANRGMRIKDLLPLTGYRRASELRKRLEELLFFGVPPFSPGDMLDVYIDEDDRVFLELPQGLDRPAELSAAEWDAVRSELQNALEYREADDPGSDLLRSLLERLSDVPLAYEDATGSRREIVEEALAEQLQLEFLYRTPAARDGEVRRVEPWALFFHHGAGYLVGYCHLRGDARFFHLERLENLELLDVPREHEPPQDLEGFLHSSPIVQRGQSGVTVELRFRPELRAVLEYQFDVYDVQEEPSGDSADARSAHGSPEDAVNGALMLRGKCKVAAPLWFRGVLRGLGAGVGIVAPEHLRADYAADLRALPVPGLLETS